MPGFTSQQWVEPARHYKSQQCPGQSPARGFLPVGWEMAVLRKVGAFLKDMWARYPLVTASAALYSVAAMMPFFTPYITYADMINQATPYNYPVPVRDDGNMPDIPSHPCDKEGPSLEWLKKL